MLQHPVAPILGNPALVRARVSVPGAWPIPLTTCDVAEVCSEHSVRAHTYSVFAA